MITVPLHTRRVQRGQFLQKLQHAVPSVVVLGDGISHLQHDPHGLDLALGAAEVGVSLLVIGTVIRGFRKLRAQPAAAAHAPHSTHGVDWIDISLGAMLLVEAYAKYHANGHIARPTLLLAFSMFAIGFSHRRIAAWGSRKRELRVTDDGVSVPGRFFSRTTLRWEDIAEIAIGPDKARVIPVNGRDQVIDIGDALDRDAVRAALEDARSRLDQSRIAPASRS
jgi:hypothetical protein